MDLENYKNNNIMKNFQILIGSPVDYEELVAYIVINGKYVALLNQDEGIENLKIEFFEDSDVNKFRLDSLLEAIEAAKNKLTD